VLFCTGLFWATCANVTVRAVALCRPRQLTSPNATLAIPIISNNPIVIVNHLFVIMFSLFSLTIFDLRSDLVNEATS